MTTTPEVILDVATPCEAAVLANLVELYSHDLSETFALELRADGRFGYEHLPRYWTEPARRFPFLIRCGTQLVGFALVTRGSPASATPEDFDVAEFFVVRRHRRAGVGQRAAFLLWNRFAGRWIVRVSVGNRGGRLFWARVIAAYTGGAFTETTHPGSPHAWCVFSFTSMPRRADV
jgi:predicted acetyltransferase